MKENLFVLFRGKVKYNGNHLFSGDWIEGSLIQKGNRFFIYHIDEDEFCNIIREIEVEVIPETVGQFIWLLDENGLKIFAGDILKSIFQYGSTYREVIGAVEVDTINPSFCIHYKFDGNGHDCYEYDFVQCGLCKNKIIGNIYDNPELSINK